MVVATRYRLKEAISQKDGIYNEQGSKEDLGTRMVLRSYVEDRNSRRNNEIYVIDEEKTIENEKLREANIIKNAEDKQKEKVTNADVVGALVSLVANKEKPKKAEKVVKVEEPKDELTIDELKEALNEAGIEFHHKAGLNKLKELHKTI